MNKVYISAVVALLLNSSKATKQAFESFGQIDSERDPLLSNIKKANPGPAYPINYPVPNFGVDQDIIDT